MEEKELLLKEIKGIIADSQKDNATKADIDARLAEINKKIEAGLNNTEMKELKEKLDVLIVSSATLEGELKAYKEQASAPANKPVKGFKANLIEAVKSHPEIIKVKKDDNGERESLIDYIKSNQRTPEIDITKSVVDMLQSSIVQNQVSLVRLTELDPERVGIPLTVYPHALDVFPVSQISKAAMSMLVAYSYEDGAGTKTEGSAPTKSSFLLKTVEFKAFDLSTYFTLSDETLDDLPEVMDEIGLVAPDKIQHAVDGKIFRDGGDGSTDIKGLFIGGDTCTDFVTTPYLASTPSANKIDLIAKMKLAIRKNKYAANFVAMNSTDIEEIQATKDLLNNSIMDKRLQFNTNGDLVKISGLTVVENDTITANHCIVGDTNKAKIGLRKGSTMQIGYNGTDFTEGQKTVKFNLRLAFGVRDKAAFQYSSDMATQVTEINKV